MELRCEHKKFGVLIEPGAGGVVEIKCSSRFCGARSGVVVLHQFDTGSGELIRTKQYKDTPRVSIDKEIYNG